MFNIIQSTKFNKNLFDSYSSQQEVDEEQDEREEDSQPSGEPARRRPSHTVVFRMGGNNRSFQMLMSDGGPPRVSDGARRRGPTVTGSRQPNPLEAYVCNVFM